MYGRLSLTARLTALYTLVSATILVGLGVVFVFATDQHFVEMDRDDLQEKIGLVEKIVRESPSSEVLTSRLDELIESHHGLSIHLSRGEQPLYGTAGGVFLPELDALDPGAPPVDWKEGSQMFRGLATRIGDQTPLSVPGKSHQPLHLMIALDIGHHLHFMQSLKATLALYLLAAILLSALLGWWAARRGLAPLRIIKERAMTVTAHTLSQRMPVEAVPLEFAGLTQSLNTMLERLQADFARLQEFSTDLAHELRTPINNLLIQTQVSLTKRRDVEAYQDILASNAEEFQRLARMVSDMLFLAKTEHGIELPHIEAISLEEEVRSLFEFYDAVADEKNIRLNLLGEARILGDRLMVRRAISNLVSNGLNHALTHTELLVSIQEKGEAVALCVSNLGATIGSDDLPRLFDRFYRVDKSRKHPESEGTGLGLSITQAIMAAHGGSVSVTSSQGQTTFCLRFLQAQS
jgi:two-component system, OmpR family, heavy metal sensor histidine kinase CusS